MRVFDDDLILDWSTTINTIRKVIDKSKTVLEWSCGLF